VSVLTSRNGTPPETGREFTLVEWAPLRRAAWKITNTGYEGGPKNVWIYFVQAGDAIKVGHASDVEARLRLLRVDNPVAVRLLAKIRGTVAGEKAIHEKFAHVRIRGEWFRAVPELLELASDCWLAQESADAAREAEEEAGLV
jgi:hypothetical protein